MQDRSSLVQFFFFLDNRKERGEEDFEGDWKKLEMVLKIVFGKRI